MDQQTLQSRWHDCLRFFEDNLNSGQYDAWFKPLTPLRLEEGKLVINAPSPYFVEQLEIRYIRLLSVGIKKVFGDNIKLYYHFNQVAGDPASGVTIATANVSTAVRPQPGSSSNPFYNKPVAAIDPQLNPVYNFTNYVEGRSNRIALSIAQAVAESRDMMRFNPCFVFGPTGVGKTHLIQAMGIRMKELNPDMMVLYVTARLFENQFTSATNDGKINDFIRFYQSIDCLIIDDIQDLRGNKAKTQNAFFHIFNHLHQNGRRLIMSSDCPPVHLEGVEERLLSRFKWGMTVEIELPDPELRRKVLRRKAEMDGLTLPDDVIEFIALNVNKSIRELEGVVVSIVAHATCLNREIDLDLARRVIDMSVKINRRQVNFEMVARQVCDFYKIKPDLLFTRSRCREVSDARQMVMYMAKKVINMSLTDIGNRLSRTHATVIHACRNIEQRIETEKKLAAEVSTIEASLRS